MSFRHPLRYAIAYVFDEFLGIAIENLTSFISSLDYNHPSPSPGLIEIQINRKLMNYI
jgi:hypothetical protein